MALGRALRKAGDADPAAATRAFEAAARLVPLSPAPRNELAQMLCKNAPFAMFGTKMGVLRGLGLPIEQAEEIAAGYLEVVEQSEDFKEGPRAFVEKRAPQWKAR